jgi:hypothetical protein
MAGHEEHARKAVLCLKNIDPSYRIDSFKNIWIARRPEHLAAFERGPRLAGLPEL